MEHITSGKLTEMSVSANLNPRQCSHLEKLWRELRAIQGGIKAPDLEKNYDLALIRRIKAKQEEIKEFLMNKQVPKAILSPEEIEVIKERLSAWFKEEIGTGNIFKDAFKVQDDGTVQCIDWVLNGFFKITRLPALLTAEGYINLVNCRSLERLSDDLVVGQYLRLDSCPNLQWLADSLEIRESLILRNCPNLQHLPENIYIGGNVEIEFCNDSLIKDARRLQAAGKIKGKVIVKDN